VSFRTRLWLAVAAVALVSLAVLAVGLRRELSIRLSADYARRVEATVLAIEDDLRVQGDAVTERLIALGGALQADNRFRLAAVAGAESERPYLLDYAGTMIGLSGLSVLQIQDEAGRIVSSGHFRNEHGRPAPALVDRLMADPDAVVFVLARTADRRFLALTRGVAVRFGGRRFTLVGGMTLDERFFGRLARDREVGVSLLYQGLETVSEPDPPAPSSAVAGQDGGDGAGPDGPDDPADPVVGRLVVPVIGADGEVPLVAEAEVLVTLSGSALQALLGRVDSWFVGTAVATAVAALLMAAWLSSRISRPLAELADMTAVLDLDRLDIEFEPRGGDEVSTLSGVLGDLTARLRSSARRLREAEHRAVVGQMARQVTHDIKNGLIPLRNVFRHLSQVEAGDPAALATVFGERRGTIDASIDYLETLATNYGRLSPPPDLRLCDLNAVVEEVKRLSGDEDVRLLARLADDLPRILADPVALRRILENLVGNAVDSLADGRGTVTVTTERLDGPEERAVKLTVADTGCGMSEAETQNIFTDFYSTKTGGTGLGLSIVRRLVLDLQGTVRVASQPGVGTEVTVQMPAGSSGRAPTGVRARERL
jgi:signal transduction histidine kinase